MEHGYLATGSHRSRKIDEWTYYSPVKDSKAVCVSVHLKHCSDGLLLEARCKMFDPIEASDVRELRGKVESTLRGLDMHSYNLEWEDWYEIEVAPSSAFNRDAIYAGFIFSYTPIKRGIIDGRAVTINFNRIVVDFPKPKAAGAKDDPGDRWFEGRNEDHQYAYVPATEVNTLALQVIKSTLERAMGMMFKLLDQSEIERVLSGENLHKLLTHED